MSDGDIVIKLHNIARDVEQYGAANLDANEMRMIADRFASYVKAAKEAEHKAVQG